MRTRAQTRYRCRKLPEPVSSPGNHHQFAQSRRHRDSPPSAPQSTPPRAYFHSPTDAKNRTENYGFVSCPDGVFRLNLWHKTCLRTTTQCSAPRPGDRNDRRPPYPITIRFTRTRPSKTNASNQTHGRYSLENSTACGMLSALTPLHDEPRFLRRILERHGNHFFWLNSH